MSHLFLWLDTHMSDFQLLTAASGCKRCPACLQGGVSVGTLEPGEPGSAGATPGADTRWPGGWRARWQAQQRGCVRFNCADSLDRTNAASYFCAVQVRLLYLSCRDRQPPCRNR